MKKKTLSIAILSMVIISCMQPLSYAMLHYIIFWSASWYGSAKITFYVLDANGNYLGGPYKFDNPALIPGQYTEFPSHWFDVPGIIMRWNVSATIFWQLLGITTYHSAEGLITQRFEFYPPPPTGGSFNSTEMSVKITNSEAERVGGIVVPVDKLALLAPYIGLASTTIIAAVATAVYVKRVKHRKEKQ